MAGKLGETQFGRVGLQSTNPELRDCEVKLAPDIQGSSSALGNTPPQIHLYLAYVSLGVHACMLTA